MDPLYTYRNLAKVRVAGSNPVFRSSYKPCLTGGFGFSNDFGVLRRSSALPITPMILPIKVGR